MSTPRLPPGLGHQYDLRNLILRRRHGLLIFARSQVRSPMMSYSIQEPRLNHRLARFISTQPDAECLERPEQIAS